MQLSGYAPRPATTRQPARRGLALFLGLTLPLSAALQAAIIVTGDAALVPLLMWVPGLAAIVTRLALHEGFADVSFRLGGRRGLAALALAYLLPLAALLAVFGVGWATGLAPFAPPPSTVFPWANDNAPLRLALLAFRGVPLVLVLNELAGACGEELGWRGYLLPRLVAAGAPHPLLLSGLIWGAWHLPLVVSGYVSGGPPLVAIPLFLVTAVALSYVFGVLRLVSGSVWPAALGHATVNAGLLVFGEVVTPGFAHNPWVGEAGALVAGGMALLALAVTWTARRRVAPSVAF